MSSSLGLQDDLDDIDLIEDVEGAFGFQLSDCDLSHCRTVGDLFELVKARLPTRGLVGNCATAMTFYRLRRAIQPRITHHLTTRNVYFSTFSSSRTRVAAYHKGRLRALSPNTCCLLLGLYRIGGNPRTISSYLGFRLELAGCLPVRLIGNHRISQNAGQIARHHTHVRRSRSFSLITEYRHID